MHQNLNLELDKFLSWEVSRKPGVCEVKVRSRVKKKVDSWIVPVGLPSVRTHLLQIIHLLVIAYKDKTLVEKRRHNPFFQLCDRCRKAFYRRNVETLLAVDRSTQKITVKKSTLAHPDSMVGSLAAW